MTIFPLSKFSGRVRSIVGVASRSDLPQSLIKAAIRKFECHDILSGQARDAFASGHLTQNAGENLFSPAKPGLKLIVETGIWWDIIIGNLPYASNDGLFVLVGKIDFPSPVPEIVSSPRENYSATDEDFLDFGDSRFGGSGLESGNCESLWCPSRLARECDAKPGHVVEDMGRFLPKQTAGSGNWRFCDRAEA